MGNQLVSTAPTQISPTEEYLRQAQLDLNVHFDGNMASTRFFKVARVRTDEGVAVCKVFLKHDMTIETEEHARRLDVLKRGLTNAVNCLPYQRAVDLERAAFLLREYVRHSLYDRVSTRPYMTTLEKRWITFQVLCALHQCHKQRIHHGDIKLENILVTSWNWVLLADFASYKPTYLPVNNPADFTYFFDTSRRRACYLAPERFLEPPSQNDATDPEPLATDALPADHADPTVAAAAKPRLVHPRAVLSTALVGGSIRPAGDQHTNELLPEMDIYAAGCALLELWSDGRVPFDLSQTLAYRQRHTEHAERVLQAVPNAALRAMIASMIALEPRERRAAEVYLDAERGRLFPDYFYTFLQSYMQMFSSVPIMSADDKVQRLYSDMEHIVAMLCRQPCDWVEESGGGGGGSGGARGQPAAKASVRVHVDDTGADERAGDATTTAGNTTNEALIIMTTLVTSCTRGLQHCITKIRCLELLQKLAEHSDSETILDRILPYILHFTGDAMARVRVCAVDTLTDCLQLITEVTRSDADVFPEYVLPAIAVLATDTAVCVRVAYARNVARLASTAVRYLEQTTRAFVDEETPQQQRYEAELAALQDMVQQTVSCLLTDHAAIVKQTLVTTHVEKLCEFLGPQKANELVLSHMITFLNDKDDSRLRGAFFDSIVTVAAYIGWQASGCLVPLLVQGLTDPDEYLIAKAIRATAQLCDRRLIGKTDMTEFVGECAAYLVHPNLAVRFEVCGLLQAASRLYSPIDVQCKVMPAIAPHMRAPVLQLDRPEIVMNNVQPALSRQVFDAVVRFADIRLLMQILEERVTRRRLVAQGHRVAPEQITTSMRNFFQRLSSGPLPELEEQQLLAFRTYLLKLHKHRAHEDNHPTAGGEGRIVLQRNPAILHEFPLIERTATAAGTAKNRLNSENESGGGGAFEWFEHLTGGMAAPAPLARSPSNSPASSAQSAGHDPHHRAHDPVAGATTTGSGDAGAAAAAGAAQLGAAVAEYNLAERTFMQERRSECRTELDALRSRLRYNYRIVAHTRSFDATREQRDMPADWRLRGQLIAHLHEHRGAVTRLTPLTPASSPASGASSSAFASLFASCSLDGTVRVWDVNRMDGHHSINQSAHVYNAAVPLSAMAAADGGRSLAVAGRDGSLMLVRIDSNAAKMALQEAKNLSERQIGVAPLGGAHNELPLGAVVDMLPLQHASDSLIVYATLYGAVVCWDLRQPAAAAWQVRTPLRNGVVTTMCADPTGAWLATGTSGGKHVCWDMRFRLPITTIVHPNEYRIRRMVAHPTEQSRFISATAGNNEVSVWDIETEHRQAALWASNAPPLANQQNPSANSSTVCGLITGTADRKPFVLTAGSDLRIRFWDLSCVEPGGAARDGGGGGGRRYAADPGACGIVVPAARETKPDTVYDSRLIDGTRVIYEITGSSGNCPTGAPAPTGSAAAAAESQALELGAAAASGEEPLPRAGPDHTPPGHTDVINDLLLCRSAKQQFYVVSASRDGVIKVWK